MKIDEIIAEIKKNGGLDIEYIQSAAKQNGVSVHEYIKSYVQESYNCGDYIAQKVADYYTSNYNGSQTINEAYNRLEGLITLSEYAKLHGRTADTVRQKILRGKLKAVKIGRNWLIDKNTPYIDHREKE